MRDFLKSLAEMEIHKDRLSLEEALYNVLAKQIVVSKERKQKEIIKESVYAFESLRLSIWDRLFSYLVKYTWRNRHYYPPRNKKKYKLFKKIYILAKWDLIKYGKISKETLEEIKTILRREAVYIKYRMDFWGKSSYSFHIRSHLFREKISLEEAALDVLILNKDDRLGDTIKFANFIEAYDSLKREQEERVSLFIPRTGERVPFPKYPVKDRRKYNLFKKIYKLAKVDLYKRGRISKETLEKVKEILMSFKE